MKLISRRDFIGTVAASGAVLAGARPGAPKEEVIDIHQHTHYSGRSDAQLRVHQARMGATKTLLLPAGSKFGLDADCGGNESVAGLARRYPDEFLFYANEVASLPDAVAVIRRYLKKGAIGIGEQKFRVACDSPYIGALAELAAEFRAPILMHFQYGVYNTGIENFHKVLEKYPNTHFIGHAQTWWSNIDLHCRQEILYPKTKVTPGGITDRLLSDYPNMHGDLSAGSGLNALRRDEDHARGFLDRHQDKLLFGSDCNDTIGIGPGCDGAQILATVRRLAPNGAALQKMLSGNAKKLFRLC